MNTIFSNFNNTISFKMNSKIVLKIAIVTAFLLMLTVRVNAITVENLPDNKVYNDFAVGPGKIEMELAPGETGTFDLMISNRLGTEKAFSLSVEDFKGSEDPNQTVVLLGNEKGPYSLKDFVKVNDSKVVIGHGLRARVPVSVSIPKNAEPGGLYGSVVVGTMSKSEKDGSISGVVANNPIFTRVGVLIFIKIKGSVKEDGKLVDFKVSGDKKFVSGLSPISFALLFKNDGNIHLNPKGSITITNILGSTVGKIDVESWFAMPKSLRFREVSWSPKFLLGKYTAIANIERGYGDARDQVAFTFYAISWWILVVAFVVVVIVLVLIKKIFKK